MSEFTQCLSITFVRRFLRYVAHDIYRVILVSNTRYMYAQAIISVCFLLLVYLGSFLTIETKARFATFEHEKISRFVSFRLQ